MFTGIVQAVGIVTRSEARGGDVRLSVDATALGVELALGANGWSRRLLYP